MRYYDKLHEWVEVQLLLETIEAHSHEVRVCSTRNTKVFVSSRRQPVRSRNCFRRENGRVSLTDSL